LVGAVPESGDAFGQTFGISEHNIQLNRIERVSVRLLRREGNFNGNIGLGTGGLIFSAS